MESFGSFSNCRYLSKSLDEYHCPITLRVFNENTHIVAIKTSGNVYAFEAVERLNIKAKFWKDLMTDESFTRKDVITIQVTKTKKSRKFY
jgi:peptidyl-prolyl cis-trans isomerase-like protein 2